MKSKITCFLFLYCCVLSAQPKQSDILRVIEEINLLRSQGCTCGSKWMPPAGPVKWDETLHEVSNKYARYMATNRHFDHVSKEGEDLGDRLDHVGYVWSKIGENLAYGYNDFYLVLEAWKDSPSHCKMLMDPDVSNMGLSKHKIYWVQSFSTTDQYLSEASGN